MVSENGIVLKHAHQEIENIPDTEKVIDLFSTKNRRLTFAWNDINKNVNVNVYAMQTILYFLILVIWAYW